MTPPDAPAAPAVKHPDPVRAVLAVGVCALLYWVILNIVAGPIGFVAGQMVSVTLSTLLAAAISGALAMAIFEARRLTDIGLTWHDGAGWNLGVGVAVAAGAALLTILPGVVIGIAHFEAIPNGDASWRAALFTPLLLLCGAAGEEIAFRGFALQYLMRAWGNWAGICGIGALFGALHAFNPSASTLGVLNTAGFGVVFGYALLRTHDLWLPIGLHFGWNATLPFLGVDLSGLTIRVTRYRLIWTAGDLWSGGAYGPEASLLASGVLLVLFAVVWRMPVRRGAAYLLDSDEVG